MIRHSEPAVAGRGRAADGRIRLEDGLGQEDGAADGGRRLSEQARAHRCAAAGGARLAQLHLGEAGAETSR